MGLTGTSRVMLEEAQPIKLIVCEAENMTLPIQRDCSLACHLEADTGVPDTPPGSAAD